MFGLISQFQFESQGNGMLPSGEHDLTFLPRVTRSNILGAGWEHRWMRNTAFSNTAVFLTLKSTVETEPFHHRKTAVWGVMVTGSWRARKQSRVVRTVCGWGGSAPSRKGLLVTSSFLLTCRNEGNPDFGSVTSQHFRVQQLIQILKTNKENTLSGPNKISSHQCGTHALVIFSLG